MLEEEKKSRKGPSSAYISRIKKRKSFKHGIKTCKEPLSVQTL